jgi:hypothetical protein
MCKYGYLYLQYPKPKNHVVLGIPNTKSRIIRARKRSKQDYDVHGEAGVGLCPTADGKDTSGRHGWTVD